eukprot:11980847-Alexandrium_andersonii.AAC.1
MLLARSASSLPRLDRGPLRLCLKAYTEGEGHDVSSRHRACSSGGAVATFRAPAGPTAMDIQQDT